MSPPSSPTQSTAAACAVVTPCVADVRPLATQDGGLWSDWEILSGVCADANVFATHWVVKAGIDHIADKSSLQLVRATDGSSGLVGLAILARSNKLGRLPLSHAHPFAHANAFVHSMVIRAGWEDGFFRAMLLALGRQANAPVAFTIASMPADSAACRGLRAACRALRLPITTEAAFERALLETNLDANAYWEQNVRAKKRKELRRQWARLDETGRVDVASLAADGDVTPWINDFLDIEQRGWKGRAGSALACSSATRAYFSDVIGAAHRRGALIFTAIRLDDRPIAMLATLIDQNAGFSFKTCFDEDYARYSPGVLLQRETLASLQSHGLRWIDSCAAPDHPMIDSLWQERRLILTLSAPLPRIDKRAVFALAQGGKCAWHAIKRHRTSPTMMVEGRSK